LTRIPKANQYVGELERALRRITREAATQFPEGQSDEAKWEWAETLSLLVFEAAKRKNLSEDQIVERAYRLVRRFLERKGAEEILGQDVPEFPGQPKEDE
jgi:hypothetical protein